MRRAFTAIELVIVVAVLLILMGMLMPAVSSVRKRARSKIARTEIEGICLALERFFADTNQYPISNSDYGDGNDVVFLGGDDPKTPPFAGSLYHFLCGPEGKGLQYPGEDRVYGPYIQFKAKQLSPCNVDGYPPGFVVKDPWGNPYIYQNNRAYFSSKEASKMTPTQRQQEAVARRAHNLSSYDIFSMGADEQLGAGRHDIEDNDNDGKIDEEGERVSDEDGDADDIGNW